MALKLDDFDAGKSIIPAIGRGWALVMNVAPIKNHYVPRPINNRYINS
jgi:hypothetical protein